jgi:hypothetical protein
MDQMRDEMYRSSHASATVPCDPARTNGDGEFSALRGELHTSSALQIHRFATEHLACSVIHEDPRAVKDRGR